MPRYKSNQYALDRSSGPSYGLAVAAGAALENGAVDGVEKPGDHRIDGWKSIAAYLGRDRSTAIRWAGDRGLPVHALPGGKSRSVYALAHELDAWMAGQGAGTVAELPPDDPPTAPPNVAMPLPPPSPSRWSRRGAALGLIALGGGALAAWQWRGAGGGALSDATMARYVTARDDVALRDGARLARAIPVLRAIAARHPDHAGVQESLAEAWLLAREFGSAPDAVAFAEARRAADAARKVAPQSVVADRVEGVAAYWCDRDPVRAGAVFRRAIANGPRDPLAHLWYANILADNGEDAAAAREFDAARMLAPGAPYLLADYGWGLWMAGRVVEAREMLDDVARRQPMLSSAHDALSIVALAGGDLAGYALHLRARAQARAERELIAYSAAIDRTLAIDAATGDGRYAATYAVMLSRALSYTQSAERPDHSWPAFVASLAGERGQLGAILADARTHGERWGAAGFVRHIRDRWRGDAALIAALGRLRQQRIEPE